MKTIQYFGGEITPSKIICIGRNYAAHARELGNEVPDEMVVFIKPNSAISGVLKAYASEPLHYETELVFMVVGGELAAVGVGLDLTKRALQSRLKAKALPWERAKAFDGAAVLSEFVALPNSIDCLRLVLAVNGEPRQQGEVSQMLFSPSTILNEIKQNFSLEDGDLIMTGTPKGVGQINAGDVFGAQIFNGNTPLLAARWEAQ